MFRYIKISLANIIVKIEHILKALSQKIKNCPFDGREILKNLNFHACKTLNRFLGMKINFLGLQTLGNDKKIFHELYDAHNGEL